MVNHHQQFGPRQFVPTLSAQLSWSHFVDLIKVEDGFTEKDLENAILAEL